MLAPMVTDPRSQVSFALPRGVPAPVRVLAILLAIVFAVESLIMLVLLPNSRFVQSDAVVTLIDATVLALTLFPVLWFAVVRPLRTLVADRGRLLAHILDVQEQERGRLARELHDELGQTQTAILLGLKAVTNAMSLDEARDRILALHDLAVSAIDSTRRLARNLSPSVLTDFGLAKALERMCEDLSAATGVLVIFNGELGPMRFNAAAEIAAYRVAQEAITNALKHSGTTRVSVEVRQSSNELCLFVRDNGRGFKDNAATSGARSPNGLGLSGMRERVVLLGGRFSIRGDAGAGTKVEASIPVEPQGL